MLMQERPEYFFFIIFFINQNANAETKLVKDILFEVFSGEFQGKV